MNNVSLGRDRYLLIVWNSLPVALVDQKKITTERPHLALLFTVFLASHPLSNA